MTQPDALKAKEQSAPRLGPIAAAASAAAPARQLALVDASAFAALRDEWDDLLALTPSASVFQSWEWAFAWWETFGDGKELRLLALRADDGRLLGLWPLYRSWARCFGRRISVLRFLGVGHGVGPDYLGCLFAPEAEPAIVPALVDWLRRNRRDWDLLRLTEIRADAEWPGRLAGAARSSRWRPVVQPRAQCFYIALPGTYEEYTRSLRGHLRRNYARRIRNLEKHCSYRHRRWDDASTLDRAIDHLGELHRRRRAEIGLAGAFTTPGYIAFHKRLAPRMHERGWLHIVCLEAKGEIVSMLYCFDYDNVMYAYQAGFDPAWNDFSVGTVLRCHVIQDAIDRRFSEIDFLKGDHSYKLDFANGERRTVSLLVSNSSVGGMTEYAHRSFSSWARTVNSKLPGPLVELARRLRRRGPQSTGGANGSA